MFVVILTAKCAKNAKAFMVCFSLFVPFALFAVHDSKTECPLYFRRENHREILENCESLYGLFLLVRAVCVVRGSENLIGVFAIILTAKCAKIANKKGSVPCRSEAVRGRVQEEGFPSPSGWEPRAVKEEEALVRTLRVVRGS